MKYWQNPNLADVLSKIIGYFNIAPALRSLDWSIALTIFYITVSLIVALILLGTYIHVSISRKTKKNNKTNHWSLALFRVCNETLQILALPIFLILLLPLKCTANYNDKLVLEDFHDVICFSGNHLVHFFVGLLTLIIFFIIIFILTVFGFEYRRKSAAQLSK